MFAPGELFGGDLSLRRWTVDTADGTRGRRRRRRPTTRASSRAAIRGGSGREHRYGYFVATRDNPDTVEFGGLIKHDYAHGRARVWDPGPTEHAGEWLFVPTDLRRRRRRRLPADVRARRGRPAPASSCIVDATDVGAGPVARIRTPQRVPYGFHGAWVPQ